MGSGTYSMFDSYPCLNPMTLLEAGEVCILVETIHAPYDTLSVEIDGAGFVYSDWDTDSLITYCEMGSVCIDKVIRGESFLVLLDWTQNHSNPWEVSVTCHPYYGGGETCEDAIELLTPVSGIPICTTGHHDDYSFLESCWIDAPGADIIYKLCLAPYSELSVDLWNECMDYSAMYLFTDCADPGNSCVGALCDMLPGGSPMHSLSYLNGSTAQELYLGIDNCCPEIVSNRFGCRMTLFVDFEPCPTPGVCCLWDGTCQTMYYAEECHQSGGDWHPEWMTCDPNPCPGVCCRDMECLILSEEECALSQGTFYPDLYSCDPNPCPAVCCIGIECQLLSEEECFLAQGIWDPGLFTCDPNPCQGSAVDPDPGQVATQLMPAWPSPSPGRTVLRYHLAEAADVEITIIDATGRLVRTLHRGWTESGAGTVTWNGRWADGRRVSPGTYFCRLKAGEEVQQQRLMIVE